MVLPLEFENKMKQLLGTEYSLFRDSYEKQRAYGLRINYLKEKGAKEGIRQDVISMFQMEPVPWAKDGYYYREECRPGRHPYHYAGLYYIQEPSAMAVAALLDPKPGERVLDLCAAPGGKSSHIASMMMGEGFLLSNEIHPARGKILSQNMERMGAGNVVVSNEDSGKLAKEFPEFFHKIVVDAPCSGEGMFRKDETARKEWSPDHVTLCAKRQLEILDNGARMLQPGGRLVYSTCTFSPEENEQTIESFLESHEDFYVEQQDSVPDGLSQGRPEWSKNENLQLKNTFRIWPHLAEGEGHFLAVLRKKDCKGKKSVRQEEKGIIKEKAILKGLKELLEQICPEAKELLNRKNYIQFGDQIYLLPEDMGTIKGMKILRPGLHLGSIKKNRIEPAHGLAMYLDETKAAKVCRLNLEEAKAYLRGESIQKPGEKGWILMTLEGCSLGWAKQSGTILKNHYPKGLRIMGFQSQEG